MGLFGLERMVDFFCSDSGSCWNPEEDGIGNRVGTKLRGSEPGLEQSDFEMPEDSVDEGDVTGLLDSEEDDSADELMDAIEDEILDELEVEEEDDEQVED